MKTELPKRKIIRLQNYDYSQNGAYFITVCTRNHAKIFGKIVGADSISARTNEKDYTSPRTVGADSVCARMIDEVFIRTIARYPNVECPKYVIMPNHFHAIITIFRSNPGQRADMESAPTVSRIMQSFKRHSTIESIKLVKLGVLPPFDKQIWQRSFYDHVIRNEHDYEEIWNYIDSNPVNWDKDCFYC